MSASELYAFIKDKSLHRVTDKYKVLETLEKKFSNSHEEILAVLIDAIESEDSTKIIEIDKKYGYGGTISNMYKIVK